MTTPTTETVKVKINVSERVTYQCTKEMPRAEFERLDKLLDDDDWFTSESARDEVMGYINKNNDWIDSTDIEVDEFNPVNQVIETTIDNELPF